MNEYLNNKSIFTNQLIDLSKALQNIEYQMDKMYKINLYLLRKYKDNLIEELNIQIPQEYFDNPYVQIFEKLFDTQVNQEDETFKMMLITTAILKEMNEEMPGPWYCYSFNNK